MNKRLYVGNIPYKVTEDDLKELFGQAGDVSEIKLIKDTASGKLKGFGFVEMASDEGALKAIEMFNKYSYSGRNLVVNEAKPMEKRTER